jgi:hypothetical protein
VNKIKDGPQILLFVLVCKLTQSCKIARRSGQLLLSDFLFLVDVMSDHVVPNFRMEFH